MSKDKVLFMGHPRLREIAAPVEDPRAAAVRALVDEMTEVMDAERGTGLAAPQIGVPLRVVVYRITPDRAAREGAEAVATRALINPVIEPLNATQDLGWEACLSVPGLAGEVPRYRHVRCRALGLEGELLDFRAAGFHARVLQHECDHLDGILYPERMRDLRRLVYASQLPGLLEAERPALSEAGESQR